MFFNSYTDQVHSTKKKKKIKCIIKYGNYITIEKKKKSIPTTLLLKGRLLSRLPHVRFLSFAPNHLRSFTMCFTRPCQLWF